MEYDRDAGGNLAFAVAFAGFCDVYLCIGKIPNTDREEYCSFGKKAVEICEMQFADAVGASRSASYLNVIRKNYFDFLYSNDPQDLRKGQLYYNVTDFLNDQYRYNTAFLTTMVYFCSSQEELYFTFSNIKSGTFDRVQYFKNTAMPLIQMYAESLDTEIGFIPVGDKLYMVRNMMTSRFRPFAVITMELDKEVMFKSLESIVGYKGYEVYLDGKTIADTGKAERGGLYKVYQKEKDKNKKIFYHDEKCYLYNPIHLEGHTMEFLVALDAKVLMNEQRFISYIIILFAVSMIPLIYIILRFLHNEIDHPLQCLVSASAEIENGNLGYTIPSIGSSREISYLGESFNSMSAELKHQFDTIYTEELALRDAKIKALQSQINPHFLNNTLEIINWEARMNGNFKVSGMIEALSTMLEATLDRSKISNITLAEELNYMEAYLYIIARRFEDKLEVHKDIDENLLQIKVPRLIIQPIVENAVEHGMDDQNRICIYITLRQMEDEFLIIEIKNHGVLSEKDKEKIVKLLNGEIEQGEKSLSIGIRNVNQRLKIIYGKDCGLTIEGTDDGYTVSTMKLRIEMPKNDI